MVGSRSFSWLAAPQRGAADGWRASWRTGGRAQQRAAPPVVAQVVLRRWASRSTEDHAGRARLAPGTFAKGKAIGVWAAGVVIGMVGLSYAFVPLYRMFCQATGYAGTANESDRGGGEALVNLAAVDGSRMLTIEFTSDVSPNLSWKFEPAQRLVRVQPGAPPPPLLPELLGLPDLPELPTFIAERPDTASHWLSLPSRRLTCGAVPKAVFCVASAAAGETTLAFYNATNDMEDAVTGISTYNVSPQKAGLYFHKIQCFCFEEQRLLAGETIDMPVFFYIDPDFADDPKVRPAN